MPVLLRRSRDLPEPSAYDTWMVVSGSAPEGVLKNPFPNLQPRLEDVFDGVAEEWRAVAKTLASAPTAGLAQMPGCAPTCSDFGLMLAWSKLIARTAQENDRVLAICDDPWLFRHLAGLAGVTAGASPTLWPLKAYLEARGFLARTKVALKGAAASLVFRRHRRKMPTGAPVILVYGHPDSRPNGDDSYFGRLMEELPGLIRVLHVDGPIARAHALAAGPRTVSLHAWGSPLAAASLPFRRWKPTAGHFDGALGWLVRRAVALEGGSGQAAMSRWQQICQDSWLKQARPRLVAWPWENHSWERGFVCRARRSDVRTLGYLHTPSGRHHWGISLASNGDGLASAPDTIVCTGPVLARGLESLGYPPERVTIGGSLRHVVFGPLPYDPDGPVLMALPNHAAVAREMESIAVAASEKGRPFLIKPHPMAPAGTRTLPRAMYTEAPLDDLPPLSAVVYAMSSIGLEALAGGLPVFRFCPKGAFVPIAALPTDVTVPTTDGAGLEVGLPSHEKPKPIDIADYYSAPDYGLWRRLVASVAPPGASEMHR